MGTRSTIGVLRPDGTAASIYCHWDGYLSNNGVLLYEHWHGPAQAGALMRLGNLSSLGKVIGEKHDFDWQDKVRQAHGFTDEAAAIIAAAPCEVEDWCVAYGRDRGEAGNEASIAQSLTHLMDAYAQSWCDYLYLWHGGTWWLWQQRDYAEWTDVIDDEGHAYRDPVEESLRPAYWQTLHDALRSDAKIDKTLTAGPRPYRLPTTRPDEIVQAATPPARLTVTGRRVVTI